MGALAEMIGYLTTADHWWGPNGIVERIDEHVRLSGLSVAVAALVALPPALWLGHLGRGGILAVSIVNIGRAVPSFAIVSLALPLSLQWGFGLGFWPTAVALVLLGIPPIFTNAYTGIRDVDRSIVEASQGMGMTASQVLWRVELPSALPLTLTGLRVSAVQIVATATLGALVGFGGLGALIIEGFVEPDDGKLLTGAVLVAALSVLTEVCFTRLERGLTPWIPRRQPVAPSAIGAAG